MCSKDEWQIKYMHGWIPWAIRFVYILLVVVRIRTYDGWTMKQYHMHPYELFWNINVSVQIFSIVNANTSRTVHMTLIAQGHVSVSPIFSLRLLACLAFATNTQHIDTVSQCCISLLSMSHCRLNWNAILYETNLWKAFWCSGTSCP